MELEILLHEIAYSLKYIWLFNHFLQFTSTEYLQLHKLSPSNDHLTVLKIRRQFLVQQRLEDNLNLPGVKVILG
jgi:hypothetical protein